MGGGDWWVIRVAGVGGALGAPVPPRRATKAPAAGTSCVADYGQLPALSPVRRGCVAGSRRARQAHISCVMIRPQDGGRVARCCRASCRAALLAAAAANRQTLQPVGLAKPMRPLSGLQFRLRCSLPPPTPPLLPSEPLRRTCTPRGSQRAPPGGAWLRQAGGRAGRGVSRIGARGACRSAQGR